MFSGKRADRSWFAEAGAALHGRALRAVVVSAAVLIPCFWQARIQAGDLSSHLYNAWLATLVQQGKAPGLWLAGQWTNVLFDYALSSLLKVSGAWAAEHIAVAAAVLVFFWGAFALVWTLNRRVPWFVTLCLAMLAYGWVFHAGFFNYYISLGIASFLFAIVWHGHRTDGVVLPFGLLLANFAHSLPVLWLVSCVAYILIARRLASRARWLLFLAAMLGIFGLREFLVHRFTTIWAWVHVLETTGADQIAVYGRTGWLLAIALLVVWCLMMFRGNPEWRATLCSLPAQLFYLCAAVIVLVPSEILLYPAHNSWFSFVGARLSLPAGVLACALVGTAKPRRWQAWTLAGVAILFFSGNYLNERELNRIEAEVGKLVAQLPPGQRVLAFIPWQTAADPDPRFVYRLETALERAIGRLPLGVRFLNAVPRVRIRWTAWHIIDRACIGHCFSYGDYEPATLQFRIRAAPGNPLVVTDGWDADAMERGRYRMKPGDLPMDLVYRCTPRAVELCICPLAAGEVIGAVPSSAKGE